MLDSRILTRKNVFVFHQPGAHSIPPRLRTADPFLMQSLQSIEFPLVRVQWLHRPMAKFGVPQGSYTLPSACISCHRENPCAEVITPNLKLNKRPIGLQKTEDGG